jgi:hypothetical protein
MSTDAETNALLKQLIESQSKAQQAPQGAITGTGIRNWWGVIVFVIMSIVSTAGWLVSKTVDGTKELTNMQNRISVLEQKTLQVDVVKTDQQKLSIDVKDLQVSVSNINKTLDNISVDIKVVAGQMQEVSNEIRQQRANTITNKR